MKRGDRGTGACIDCGDPVEGVRWRCDPCRAVADRQKAKDYYAKHHPRRRSAPRALTLGTYDRLTPEELRAIDLTVPDVERPRTRGDCCAGGSNEERPCPWVSCRHHLAIDVTPSGSLKLNFPKVETWELADACALDVAERGGITLDEVGQLLNLTRERVRQVEVKALVRSKGLRALVEDEP